MIDIDWGALLMGFAVGSLVSLLFFAGLAWGVRLALRSRRPSASLLLSFAFRITVLLGCGYWVATTSANLWPLAGYALAFFLVRLVSIAWANAYRIPAQPLRELV